MAKREKILQHLDDAVSWRNARIAERKAEMSKDRGKKMNKNDGGPAFPMYTRTDVGGVTAHGMTLRDWFAGQALVGLAITMIDSNWNIEDPRVAKKAYQLADAMLEERDKAKPPKED